MQLHICCSDFVVVAVLQEQKTILFVVDSRSQNSC